MTKKLKISFAFAAALVSTAFLLDGAGLVFAKDKLDIFVARPPFHIKDNGKGSATVSVPSGLAPQQVRAAYNLPSFGGNGTIAIVDAYNDPNIENDLNVFSNFYGLPQCSSSNGCFEKHLMARTSSNAGWALEESLDVQWAHAIAPQAKILLVVAKSASGTDLLNAVNYARNRSDVVSVSMSWGGSEFSGESAYDSSFTSVYGAAFFASAGDNGAQVEWPAVSANVIGVGGTSLSFANNIYSESAWSGSGGGLSLYEAEPAYQAAYGVPQANGFRAVPDVSYVADPNTGVSVYDSYGYNGQKGWFTVGGTSVGAPQWAAIKSLGNSVSAVQLYSDAASSLYSTLFRDVVSGSNGTCGFYCNSALNYDYVTGLGSPLSVTY